MRCFSLWVSWLRLPTMRGWCSKEGRGLYWKIAGLCVPRGSGRSLAGAADAELLLHFLELRPDLLHRAADFLRVGLERLRPVGQGLGPVFDFRRIGRKVLRHAVQTVRAPPSSDRASAQGFFGGGT